MDSHLIGADATVMEALEALNRLSGATMTLFVVDADRKLLGSLTDGDVRRALLAGHSLSDPAATICRRQCLTLPATSIAEARRRGIRLLPVVEDGMVVELIDLRRQRGLVDAEAVLMAGGVGERLRPLTEHTPKPLLPVGGTPVIDHNIALLRSFGISDISVTVNYLKESIIAHLAQTGGAGGIKVVEEPAKLGTIGSLSLIERFSHEDIIVMNADLLTDINLEEMQLRHRETRAWLTMAVVPYTVSVPFAIVGHQGDRVTGITEKPTYNYYANAGIYMLRREAARMVPKGASMDAPGLIDLLLEEGRRVTLFPIEGRWIDIGSPDDYRHACEIMGADR